ncbi:MAG: DUF2007 domain-containing protein [Verrucomicrobiota bacterium]
MQPITVFRTFSSAEAHVVRSRLEAAGFHASVEHELAALTMEGYSQAAGGILVQVPDAEADDAKELLAAEEEAS